MYIPKNRIKTNLYTAGGEYVFKGNQEEYKGYFHSLYDGTFYTGRTPNDPPIVEIISILNSSNAQIEADVVDLPYQYFADNYDGVVFDGQIQDVKAVGTYHIVNDINYDKTQLIPQQSYPRPTPEDYELGSFTRYFCVKYNEDLYTELSKETYDMLVNEDQKISWQMYMPFKIQWTIDGEKSFVETTNSNIVEIQEKRMKRIGFGRFLKFNFLKFCKGIN
jgi:hypothetical protein